MFVVLTPVLVRLGPLCSDRERSFLIEYLKRTPVAGISDDLALWKLTVRKAHVEGRGNVGALRTIFGNLGQVFAAVTLGHEKFLVGEVRYTLARSDSPDPVARRTIESLIDAERQGLLHDRTLTAMEMADGLMLVDGNKRAVAIYEASPAPDLALDLFVISPSRQDPAGE